MLVAGEMVDADRALELGLVDELVEIDHVATRARIWLEGLLALPRQPMLQTRALARVEVIAALAPENIRLERFVDAWSAPDTQAGLRALLARLGK
jgi:enoyl-CoA hydratase/carnithine racemase